VDEKSRDALMRWGPKKILSDLVNASSHEDATEFVARYGALRSDVRKIIDEHDNEVAIPALIGPFRRFDVDSASEVMDFAPYFRAGWTANSEPAKWAVNRFLDGVFSPGLPGEQPTMAANFDTGEWEPRARTLLDALAIELMRSRKMLARCERSECGRYFVKEFSRDRYCSNLCSEEMRRRGQRQWALDHRKELNRRPKARKKTRRIA
jgi:hypothetical protein